MKMAIKKWSFFVIAGLALGGTSKAHTLGDDLGLFKDWYDAGCRMSQGAAGAPASGAQNPGGNEAFCQLCDGDSGMPRWWVDEPYINLHITDEPLAYNTSSGQRISFRFLYKQRFCVPGTNVTPAAVTNYYERDYYAAMRTCGLTNAGWGHNWMRDITFWDSSWETNRAIQSTLPLFEDGYDALVFGPEGGVYYFYSNSMAYHGQTNLADALSQAVLSPRPFANYPRLTNSPAADSQGIYWGTENLVGFKMNYPDGSQDIFGLAFSEYSLSFGATTNRTTSHALLTQKIDPQGRATKLGYERVAFPDTNSPSYYAYRLKYVVDSDGRTNAFHYDLASPLHPWQVTEIDDAYGREAFISYDAATGRLNGITDAATNSSGFDYDDSTGWITNMTTPYGTTSFRHFQDPATPTNNLFYQRAACVTLPNGASHLFYYLHEATNGVPASAVSPTNVPYSGSYESAFDNGSGTNAATEDFALTYRDSFHWDERQFTALSSGFTNYAATNLALALASLQPADFRKAHMKHWLLGTDQLTVSQSVSCERDASPDSAGSTEGAWTWYRYANKTNGVEVEGNAQISCVARLLPDASTQYARYNYSSGTALVSDNESTHSLPDGTVAEFTNFFSYAANNIDLLSVSNSAGQSTRMGYNGVHQVTAVTNALNEVTTLVWDTNTFKPQIISLPSGQSLWFYYYDPAGPGSPLDNNSGLLEDVYNDATDLDFHIDDYSNGLPHIVITDAANTPTTYITNTWDGLNRLTSVTFQDGTTVSNIYNILDLAAHQDRVGNWTYFGYDALEHLTSITNALTNVTTLDWCGCGALTDIYDALSNHTAFYYDNQGRLTETLYPDLSSVSYEYDLLGRTTNTFDGTGRFVRFIYNNQGLVTTVSNAAGMVSRVVYDSLDRPSSVTDANNLTVTNAFDLLNRLVSRTWPDGTNEGWGYATNGLIAYTNRDHQVTRYLRDAAGRALAVTNANQEAVQYAYDGFDRIYQLTDGLGHTRRWEYNPWGGLQTQRDLSGNFIAQYAYDADGRLTNRWTPGSTNTSYAYDSVGNLLNITYPGSATPGVSMIYDKIDRLTNIVDGVGTNTFAYTQTGQLQSESFQSVTLSNAYTQGARTAMTVGTSGTNLSFTYGYDSTWRLQSLSSPAGSFTYGYPASASTLVQSIALPNGANIVNGYDGLSRLTNTALQNVWGHVLDGYGYAYGRADYRTGITRSLGLTTNTVAAAYDNIGQLIKWTASETGGAPRANEQLGYGYDAAHNLATRTNNALIQNFTVDAFDELTNVSRTGTLTVGGATPAPATNVSVNGTSAQLYGDLTFAATNFSLSDGANRFVIKATNVYSLAATNTVLVNLPVNVALAYDTNGNLTGDGTRTFYYDAENRLTNVNVAGAWKTEFAYDGFGRRRIERDYTWNGSTWSQTNETHFVFDGLVPIQERDSNNAVLVTYTRGLDFSGGVNGAGGIGGLLARTDSSGSTFYHADGSGNVTALIDGMQNIVARYEYDPYGRMIGQWGKLAQANTMRFSSMPSSPNSGLIGYHARFYEPGFQRWLNRDPIGESGGINLYGFVGNGPVNGVDAFGEAGDPLVMSMIHANGYTGQTYLAKHPGSPLAPSIDPNDVAQPPPISNLAMLSEDYAQDGGQPPTFNGVSATQATKEVLKAIPKGLIEAASWFVGIGEEKAAVKGISAMEKEGAKALEEANNLKRLKECEGVGKVAMEDHHLLPKQFADKFKAKGLDPEEFKIPLPKDEHRLVPDGIHTGPYGDSWNGQWKQFFESTPGASKQDILDQLAKMRKEFGI